MLVVPTGLAQSSMASLSPKSEHRDRFHFLSNRQTLHETVLDFGRLSWSVSPKHLFVVGSYFLRDSCFPGGRRTGRKNRLHSLDPGYGNGVYRCPIVRDESCRLGFFLEICHLLGILKLNFLPEKCSCVMSSLLMQPAMKMDALQSKSNFVYCRR